MISFPRFGQYTSESYIYNSPDTYPSAALDSSLTRSKADPRACASSAETIDTRYKIRKSKKSRKSILMDLLYNDNEDPNDTPLTSYFHHDDDDDYRYICNSQPKLSIRWGDLPKTDPNYDMHSETFPNAKYITRYFSKLGLPDVTGLDIKPPYEFGYYTVLKKKKQYILEDQPTSRRGSSAGLSVRSGKDTSDGTSISSNNSQRTLDSRRKKKSSKILRYGARCGHCHQFIRIKNESAEGGFLSYISYFKHWMNHHYDN